MLGDSAELPLRIEVPYPKMPVGARGHQKPVTHNKAEPSNVVTGVRKNYGLASQSKIHHMDRAIRPPERQPPAVR